MKLIHLATATAVVALLGGAAYAQQPTSPVPADAPPVEEAAPPADTTADTGEPTTAPSDVTATSATSVAGNVSVTTTTVTNGPVPDTAENRAKYGQPLSRAGRLTAARGN